jgi:hypothetical protein
MTRTNMVDRAPRLPIRLSAEIKTDGLRLTGTTRNLSPGGVCVELDRPVAEGKSLAISLFVVEDDIESENARGLDLTGTVQWTAEGDRSYAVGIKFTNMTPAQTTALGNALRALGVAPG